MAIDTQIATRISIEEYHTMIVDGLLESGDRTELLDGQIVTTMGHNPPHADAITCLLLFGMRVLANLPEWLMRFQLPITLDGSEPQPDFAIVSGSKNRYRRRHPGPSEIALVVEVADSSSGQDQDRKQMIYARAGLPIYWIVNIQDACVEVYTQPIQEPTPHYNRVERFRIGDRLPLMLAGIEVGQIDLNDFFIEIEE